MFAVRGGLLRSSSVDPHLASTTNGSSSVKGNERCYFRPTCSNMNLHRIIKQNNHTTGKSVMEKLVFFLFS